VGKMHTHTHTHTHIPTHSEKVVLLTILDNRAYCPRICAPREILDGEPDSGCVF